MCAAKPKQGLCMTLVQRPPGCICCPRFWRASLACWLRMPTWFMEEMMPRLAALHSDPAVYGQTGAL